MEARRGSETADLLGAIQALSQLSYGPLGGSQCSGPARFLTLSLTVTLTPRASAGAGNEGEKRLKGVPYVKDQDNSWPLLAAGAVNRSRGRRPLERGRQRSAGQPPVSRKNLRQRPQEGGDAGPRPSGNLDELEHASPTAYQWRRCNAPPRATAASNIGGADHLVI